MMDDSYHKPDRREQAFLRIVTSGYPELQAQIESCEVGDYDPDGYCDVRVLSGPPSRLRDHCNGPVLLPEEMTSPSIETILWITDDGLLNCIEILGNGGSVDDIYERFIDGAAKMRLLNKSDAD